MTANTSTNLFKYSIILSFLIVLNYFLWSINSYQILKFINLFFIFVFLLFFFLSKDFNYFWYLKIIIFLMIIISLGTPTIPNDSRLIYLFSAKILFYESNLYTFLENYGLSVNNYFDIVNSRPKFAATLSASFAQLIGNWNEVYPKSTNIIILLPPLFCLISFINKKNFSILWIFLILFFSGKLFINGLLDSIIGIYFVACFFITYKIIFSELENEKNFYYASLILFSIILTLIKNEGFFMIMTIFLSSMMLCLYYRNKIDYMYFFCTLISFVPILIWKIIVIFQNIKFEWIQSGDAFGRIIERINNVNDLNNIFTFIIHNEKLVISLLFFIVASLLSFKKNRKLIFFTSMNFLIYFSIIILGLLVSPHDLLVQLEASFVRTFVPLILLLCYSSVLLIKSIDKKEPLI